MTQLQFRDCWVVIFVHVTKDMQQLRVLFVVQGPNLTSIPMESLNIIRLQGSRLTEEPGTRWSSLVSVYSSVQKCKVHTSATFQAPLFPSSATGRRVINQGSIQAKTQFALVINIPIPSWANLNCSRRKSWILLQLLRIGTGEADVVQSFIDLQHQLWVFDGP